MAFAPKRWTLKVTVLHGLASLQWLYGHLDSTCWRMLGRAWKIKKRQGGRLVGFFGRKGLMLEARLQVRLLKSFLFHFWNRFWNWSNSWETVRGHKCIHHILFIVYLNILRFVMLLQSVTLLQVELLLGFPQLQNKMVNGSCSLGDGEASSRWFSSWKPWKNKVFFSNWTY